MTDSHCHLNHERFADDVDAAVDRAVEAHVDRLVVVGYDVPSSEQAVSIATSFPQVYATVGVHPHDARTYDEGAVARLRELAAHSRVVAVGEIGLDYHYNLSPPEAQRAAFRSQLALAAELALPVVIHCREAYGEALDILAETGAPAGVMHCWAGSADDAERSLQMGLYLGFGGVLTFRNAEETRRIAADTPLDRLLIETDAPYLAPVPHRGKRNEPAWVAFVAERLAVVRGTTTQDIAAATSANAHRLFPRLF